MEKKCFKCGAIKARSEFYKHPKMGDGLLGKCKECTKKDVADREARLSQDPEWIEKERERCRNKTARARARGELMQTSQQNREAWRKRNRNKARAQGAAKRAADSGKIERFETCEFCISSPSKDMHHFDYSRPIDVIFVCKACHGVLHRKHKSVPIGARR